MVKFLGIDALNFRRKLHLKGLWTDTLIHVASGCEGATEVVGVTFVGSCISKACGLIHVASGCVGATEVVGGRGEKG